MTRLTENEFDAFLAKKHRPGRLVRCGTGEPVPIKSPRTKHRNVKIVFEGEVFDSKLELRVWQDLKLREKAGEIRGLRRQVRCSLFGPNFEHIGVWKADFRYEEFREMVHGSAHGWTMVWADAKSSHTRALPAWQRTRKLFRACTGREILELP